MTVDLNAFESLQFIQCLTVRERLTITSIGAACARALLLKDVDLALHYSSNSLAIDELVAELRKTHEQALPQSSRFLRITTHHADLSTVEGPTDLLEQVQAQHGRSVDILVSNAGLSRFKKDIWDVELDDWETVMGVNLRAGFLLAKGVVKGIGEGEMGRFWLLAQSVRMGA